MLPLVVGEGTLVRWCSVALTHVTARWTGLERLTEGGASGTFPRHPLRLTALMEPLLDGGRVGGGDPGWSGRGVKRHSAGELNRRAKRHRSVAARLDRAGPELEFTIPERHVREDRAIRAPGGLGNQ